MSFSAKRCSVWLWVGTGKIGREISAGGFIGWRGDSYGVGLEASASAGKDKANSHTGTWQNNRIQAGKLVTNSSEGKLRLEATQVKTERWEGHVQGLELISRQDVTQYQSEQVQAGGTAFTGGASFHAGYSEAE